MKGAKFTNKDRFDRQVRFFGAEGQQRLRTTRVVVVGAGGLGSHILQQLAFLGVGSISLIDPDVVEVSNLNRLIGAQHDDASLNTSKVDVGVRLIHAIDPKIEVKPFKQDLICKDSFDAVKEANFVFGCVDHDGPRLVLTELCTAYRIPYCDTASEILPGPQLAYGGRLCFSHGGRGCLACLNLLSYQEAQDYFLSSDARLDKQRLYGVPRQDLAATGPSVVTLNGVIASLATTEFMLNTTGLREPRRLLFYRANEAKVTVSLDEPRADCFYCKSVYGSGQAAKVERYLN